MHPLDHARSSEAQFGVSVEASLALHQYFDATKAAFGDWRHRALRHHTEAFPAAIRAKCASLEPRLAERICEQHLLEDLGRLACQADWREALQLQGWMRRVTHDPEVRARSAARRFGGEVGDTVALHAWLDARCAQDPGMALFRHHAWGLFEAEAHFGLSVRIAGRDVPIRVILEAHLREEFGRLPSAQDWLMHLELRPFMTGRGA